MNMNGEVIRLGQSIQVTLPSHEVARLAEISGLAQNFLDPDLKTRSLHPPEEFVSKKNLVLAKKKGIYQRKFEVIHFVRMFHYLQIE